jgi:hypothetical protein
VNTPLRKVPAWALAPAGILWFFAALGAPATVSAAEPCAADQICGLKNAEDLIRLPGSHWAIASRLGKDPEAPGGFSLVDLERRTAHVLIPDISTSAAAIYADCPGAPVPSALVTHGLDLRWHKSGAGELLAVNHGGRQSIEVFDVHLNGHDPKLTWKGCVILPPDVSANAVAALPEGMAVTSFGSRGDQGMAELLAGKPAGFAVLWRPKKGWAHVAGSEFGGDNGLAAAPDGGALYVNDWTDGTLRVLSLRDGIAPVTIKVGDFHPDNVHVLPDGNLLIAGQMGKPGEIMSCVTQSTCAVGSMIAVVDPRSREVRSHWALAPTATFAAASTALLYGNDYWVSSFRGDRIVRVVPQSGQ